MTASRRRPKKTYDERSAVYSRVSRSAGRCAISPQSGQMSQDIVDTDQAVARWAWVTTWWPGLCSRAAAGVLCLLVAGCGTVAPSSSPSASAGSRELAATDPLYFNAVSEPGHRGGQPPGTLPTGPGGGS